MLSESKKQDLKYVTEKIMNTLEGIGENVKYDFKLVEVLHGKYTDVYNLSSKRYIGSYDVDRISFQLASSLGLHSIKFTPCTMDEKPSAKIELTNNYPILKTDSLKHQTILLIAAVKRSANWGKTSAIMLQNNFNLSYDRSVKLIEQMEALDILGPADGMFPRMVTISATEVPSYEEIIQDMYYGHEPPEHRPDDTRLLRLLSLFNVEADMRVVRRTPTTIILEYSFINEATYKKVKELSTELSMRLNAPSFRIIQGVKYDFGAEIANDELHLLEWK